MGRRCGVVKYADSRSDFVRTNDQALLRTWQRKFLRRIIQNQHPVGILLSLVERKGLESIA